MVDVPTVRLRDVIAALPSGGVSGVVSQDLTIRNDLVTSAEAVPTGGLTGQVLSKASGANFDTAWVDSGAGDMIQAMYDPQMIQADAFARANHTGTQPASTITGLAAVATSGSYADLSNKPTSLAPRSSSAATAVTLTPNADNFDIVSVTAQAGALTVASPVGTPLDGQQLTVRVRDNGTIRAITWNAAYSASPSVLPTATVVGVTMIYRFVFNSNRNVWDLLMGNPIGGLWS